MTKEQKGAAGSGSRSGTGSGSGCGAGAVVFDGRDYSEKSTAARTIRQVGGKDRHSKVVTWRGPRDRRIRLSVATAIQLYDVQDRLGYDQPSKAVEWLLSKAKPSIHALPLLHHPITAPTTLHYGKAKLEEEDEEEEEELASSSCEQPHLKSNTPPNVEPFLWTSPPNHLLHGLMQQSMNYNYPLPSSSSLSQVAMSRLDPFMPIPNGSSSVNNDLNGVQVQPIMSAHQLHNEHLLSLLKAPSLFHPTPSNSSSSTSRPDPLYRHLQNSSRLDNQAKGNNGSGYAACYSINSGSVEEQANSGSLMSALGIPHRSVHNSIHSNTSNITFLEHQLKQNSSSTTRYSTDLRHDGVGYIGQASNTATDVNNFDPRTFD